MAFLNSSFQENDDDDDDDDDDADDTYRFTEFRGPLGKHKIKVQCNRGNSKQRIICVC
ncbi:hypothetical protein G9A89_022671 [Geosiphon pyriformis]|nr:hypothetical protein G9A89_022671 [Geosiphon pyriformis]